MASHVYYVEREGAQWKIKRNNKEYQYEGKFAAIKAAIHAAYEMGRLGHDAEVHSRDIDGRWQVEWTYGHDPYPPKV